MLLDDASLAVFLDDFSFHSNSSPRTMCRSWCVGEVMRTVWSCLIRLISQQDSYLDLHPQEQHVHIRGMEIVLEISNAVKTFEM
jgi:hypothetical protein